MTDVPSPTTDSALPSADYSLRASGSTYLERNREAEKIIDRIKNSSASVIGISGVRGAGKSSLAKKVLEQCDEAGYFTLLIPSPTGYEPREFLLAIFQRIAEHASEQVRRLFEGIDNLAALGDDAARTVRLQSFLILGGALLLVCAVAGGAYYGVYTEARKVEAERQKLLEAQVQSIGVTILRKGVAVDSTLSLFEAEAALDHDSVLKVRNLFREKNMKIFDANIEAFLPQELQYLKLLADRTYSAANLEVDTGANYYRTIGAYAIISISIFVLMPAMLIFLRLTRKYRKYRTYNKQAGLASKSREFLNLIKYQKVLSTGSELSLPLKYFTGKLSRSQQLTDRPLSLPGLTAECSTYMQQVAEVFNGKVIVCIDELDKITDVTALLELLKGIKGILGQENTYFLLTISEDAMAFFTERLNRERNLVESSFEEIVYLDRLPYELSARVVRQSLAALTETPPYFSENVLILWLFGAGIPREIKRNMITCSNEKSPITTSHPRDIWRILYRAKLSAMLVLSAPKANESQEHYRFLICIEQIIRKIDELELSDRGREFGETVLNIIRDNFQPNFKSLTEQTEPRRAAHRSSAKNGKNRDAGDLPDPNLYLAQLMEAIIGTIAIALIEPANENKDRGFGGLDALIYVYKFIPINPQYAFYVLDKFLHTRLHYLNFSLELLGEAKRRNSRALIHSDPA